MYAHLRHPALGLVLGALLMGACETLPATDTSADPVGAADGAPDGGEVKGPMDAMDAIDAIDAMDPRNAMDPRVPAPGMGAMDAGAPADDAGAASNGDASGPEPTEGGASDDGQPPVATCELSDCDENATCEDGQGVAVCTCVTGYAGDGTRCIRDECVPLDGEPPPCQAHALCEDGSGATGDHTCTCEPGYPADDTGACIRDECVPLASGEPGPCGLHMRCVDPAAAEDGAVECTCEPGFAQCAPDAVPADGCPIMLEQDPEHCGSCGQACTGDLGCTAGECDQAAWRLALGPGRTACAFVGTPNADGASNIECWGDNGYQQQRADDAHYVAAPTDLAKDVVRDVALGERHSCVVMGLSDDVVCWGDNSDFQLGTNRTAEDLGRLEETNALGAVEVAVGQAFTCVRFDDGTVKCMGASGANGVSASGPSTSLAEVPTVANAEQLKAAANEACARDERGNVVCWGPGSAPRLIRTASAQNPLLADVVQIDMAGAAGFEHTCARTGQGKVLCWGILVDGTFADYATEVALPAGVVPVDIATSFPHDCLLDASGKVYCWGANNTGGLDPAADRQLLRPTPTEVPGIDDAIDIEGSVTVTCARRRTGQVVCWGSNEYGDLGDGSVLPREEIRAPVGLP